LIKNGPAKFSGIGDAEFNRIGHAVFDGIGLINLVGFFNFLLRKLC
jgi:hypothetical protein